MNRGPRLHDLGPRHAAGFVVLAVIAAVGLAVVAARFSGQTRPDVWERIPAMVQAVGIVSLAVSFVAVAAQLRQANRALKAQMFDQTAQRMAHLNELMLMAPTARGVLHGAPGKHLDHEVAVLAEATIDYFDTELLRQAQFPDLLCELPDFRPWMVQAFQRQEGLRHHIETHLDWYRDELFALYLRAQLADRFEPAVDRLVFVRRAKTTDPHAGASVFMAAPPTAVRGDVLALVRQNDQVLIAAVVGTPEAGGVLCRGLALRYDPYLPEGELLSAAITWPELGAGSAGAVTVTEAKIAAETWGIIPAERARTWLAGLAAAEPAVAEALDARRGLSPKLARSSTATST